MPMANEPVIGNWYINSAGDSMEVVAYDPDDGTVEVQFYDGTVEEYDTETWHSLNLEATASPEGWSGSYDIERADYGVDLDGAVQSDRLGSLDDLDREE